ncbi:discoidin domain-containing protein [Fulvitalea axinellae]|uniref:discoidin domain-containing protein n=1 Tax=Fulvitalea axinellae TaxID=1182444 RepID=UPI0030CA1BA2
MNTEKNSPYSADDISKLKSYLDEKSVAFFAMGSGDKLDELNALTANFGFTYEKVAVDGLKSTTGGSVTPSNEGFALNLTNPEKWENLVVAGNKPVVSIMKTAGGYVIASGIDIFSNRSADNVVFFNQITAKAVSNMDSYISLSPTNFGGFDYEQRNGKRRYRSSLYLKEKAEIIDEIAEEVIPEVALFTGRENGDDVLDILLMPGNGGLENLGGSALLGAYNGNFPESKDGMMFELGKAFYSWTKEGSDSPLDSLALSIHTSAEVVSKLGVANAFENYVNPIIEEAKSHPDYKAFDPMTMSEEELKAFPANVATGKMLNMIKQLKEKYGESIVKDYHTLKTEKLPEGFPLSGHNDAWLWADASGDRPTVFQLFNEVGYSVTNNKVTIPDAFNEEFIEPDNFKATALTNGNNLPSNMFDGTKNLWQSPWSSPPPYPHVVTIDLNDNYKLTSVDYYPRLDKGRKELVSEMDFYVSEDGSNWGDPVFEYRSYEPWKDLSWEESVKKIYFTEQKTGRYVKIVIHETLRKGKWVKASSIAELKFYQFKGYK